MQTRSFEGAVTDVDLRDFAHFVDVGIARENNQIACRHAAILGPHAIFVATEIGRSFAPLGEKPHRLLGLTEVLPFGPAVFAKTAGDRTDHDDAVADAKILDIRADFDDLAQSVVADGHRQIGNRLYLRAVLYGIFAHVQVAVIETGAQHANQHLTGETERDPIGVIQWWIFRVLHHSSLPHHALALSFCVHQRTMEPMWQGAPAFARAASKI